MNSDESNVPSEEAQRTEVVVPWQFVRLRPRIWSAILVGTVTLPIAFLFSGLTLAVGLLLWRGPTALQNVENSSQILEEFSATLPGVFVIVAPGQFVFLGVALVSACSSAESWRTRLRLVRGSWPLWKWLILILATPAVGFVTSWALSFLQQSPSNQLRLIEGLFHQEDGRHFLLVVLLIGVLPGLSEEFLFRGYVQSRLAQAWPAWVAIGVTTLLFAIAHLDPLHSLAVLPLGAWLGVVAWRTGSLFPSVLGHMLNNTLAACLTRWDLDPTRIENWNPATCFLVIVTGLTLVGATTVLVWRTAAADAT